MSEDNIYLEYLCYGDGCYVDYLEQCVLSKKRKEKQNKTRPSYYRPSIAIAVLLTLFYIAPSSKHKQHC